MIDAGGTARLAFVQVLRGFAALTVVYWHFLEAGISGTRASAGTQGAQRASVQLADASPLLFDAGQMGVAIFFIISGFVIPFAFQRQGRLGFLLGRFFRIWPAYAAGFTISLFVLLVIPAFGGEKFAYSLSHILAHYSLISRDIAGFSNIDLIVWTLEIEIRFYLFCALIAPLLRASNAVWVIAAGFGVSLAGIVLCEVAWLTPSDSSWINVLQVSKNSAQFIGFMMIGVLFHLVLNGKLAQLRAAICGAAFFLVFLWVGTNGLNLNALPWAINYGSGLALFTAAYMLRNHFVETGLLGKCGAASYSLYVVHPLLGGWTVYYLTKAGVAFLPAAGFGLVIVAASTWLLYELVEKPSHAFGRKISARTAHQRSSDIPVAQPSA